MTRVIEMRAHAQCDNLCLLDELGSGTQAEEGLAFACATIETLVHMQGAFVIQGIAGNKNGDFETAAQILSKLHTNNG